MSPPPTAPPRPTAPRPLLLFPNPFPKRRHHVHHLSPPPSPTTAAPRHLSGRPRTASSPPLVLQGRGDPRPPPSSRPNHWNPFPLAHRSRRCSAALPHLPVVVGASLALFFRGAPLPLLVVGRLPASPPRCFGAREYIAPFQKSAVVRKRVQKIEVKKKGKSHIPLEHVDY
ncbi:Os12g0289833 [Oryza sativa Japonica Group]|uniref:Os12g0289833 protein n=1 Tax=Oryza sativa subsp. japonica TaxID=39947 RepID=A0A0P0Y9A5_ORYSJ|nr:Os12g0289833 [Oryza sativa Japonica Group]